MNQSLLTIEAGLIELGKRLTDTQRREVGSNNRLAVQSESVIRLYNENCITGMAKCLPESSIDLAVTSIPFEELFTYSGKPEDVGNNGSTVNIREGRFAIDLQFVIAQLFRVLKPGCNACIHIQQLLAYKNQHGFIGRRDFRGAVIDLFAVGGFEWKGEFVISKNPQAMAQRLNLHCLMFATGKRNATMLAPAPNDYVLIFQKPGDCEHPVPALYDPKINPGGWVTSNEWIRDAHGIWTDIQQTDVLDGYRAARESDQEKHVCPLQLEVIRRLVRLYTNPAHVQPDVTVLDPFMGIGSTAYIAVEQGRNAVGFELKESYYRQSMSNVKLAKALKLNRQESMPLLAMSEAA